MVKMKAARSAVRSVEWTVAGMAALLAVEMVDVMVERTVHQKVAGSDLRWVDKKGYMTVVLMAGWKVDWWVVSSVE